MKNFARRVPFGVDRSAHPISYCFFSVMSTVMLFSHDSFTYTLPAAVVVVEKLASSMAIEPIVFFIK
ncbi:hypothetical protein UA44_06430 [Klebsiella aerogenes]|jgi:hypothetical protein|nr:hypothetical protein UA44_15220 [Klebsiella aerogenes]KJF83746.1 hypothetical protein UA44_06430 [Klebsiella aerogenes]